MLCGKVKMEEAAEETVHGHFVTRANVCGYVSFPYGCGKVNEGTFYVCVCVCVCVLSLIHI